MPLSGVLDTAGFFARDATLFNLFAQSWYGDAFKSYTTYPKKIYNGLGNVTNPASAAIFASFVEKLTSFVNGSQENITLASRWNTTKPASVSLNLTTYLNTTYPTLIGYEQATVLGDPFNTTYQSTFKKQPFFDPVVLIRWAFGRSQGSSGHQAALQQKETFKAWFNSTILIPDNTTCSNAIYVYPQSTGAVSYRNQYFLPSGAPTGFSNGRISVFTEIPDIVVPIGQVAYNSTISGTLEYLPVTISLMAAKGCDYMLLNLIEALSTAGIISGVKVGAAAF
jgi:Asp-tRNA(Asn)/Glu-tRNA(Gln) amidotransferase A subunit family amidase